MSPKGIDAKEAAKRLVESGVCVTYHDVYMYVSYLKLSYFGGTLILAILASNSRIAKIK